MPDLATTYMGLELAHPLIAGASPLSASLDGVRRLEDAGAAAIVLPSLFEEQIVAEALAVYRAMEGPAETFSEARTYLPEPGGYTLGTQEYLEHVRSASAAVRVPVIASLNGVTLGCWLEFARQLEQAGAAALELNVFRIPTDPHESAAHVEGRTLEMVAAVRAAVSIPIAVKLAPFYTALAHFAAELERAGAAGLVLFNRFYEPDLDAEALDYAPHLQLSSSAELLLRLRWLAILSARVGAALAVSGGVHSTLDVIKASMAGAAAVQLVSLLLRSGPGVLRSRLAELRQWLAEHDYSSLRQLQGSMNLERCPDPAALERGNYIHMLQTWRP